jgi:hypothetical protein
MSSRRKGFLLIYTIISPAILMLSTDAPGDNIVLIALK